MESEESEKSETSEEVEPESNEDLEKRNYLTPRDLSKMFLKRAKHNKDSVVGVTGYEGDGKSTLACWIVIEMLRAMKKTEEEIERTFNDYMIYSPKKEHMEKTIKSLPRYSPINADEAIKALYKLKWGSNSQIYLNQLYALARKENKTSILCMPRFGDFNEYFRNHRIRYWIHVIETGVAVLFFKDWSPFGRDPWWIDENQKLVNYSYNKNRKKVVDFSAAEKIAILRKMRIFVAEIRFEDLPIKYKKIYLEGKEKFGYDDMDEETLGARGEKWLSSLKESCKMLYEQGVKVPEIAERIGMTTKTVYEYLELSHSPNSLIKKYHIDNVDLDSGKED